MSDFSRLAFFALTTMNSTLVVVVVVVVVVVEEAFGAQFFCVFES
jgi:hypothetical protein